MQYLLYAIIAVLPFVILNGHYWDYSNLPKEVFLRCGALLSASWLLWRLPRMKASRSLMAWMIFLGWAAVSLFWAVNRYEGVLILSYWLTLALIWFVVENMEFSRHTLFQVVAFSAGGVALIGLLQYFFNIGWFVQSAPPAATFANCNIAAGYVTVALPVVVYLAVMAAGTRKIPYIIILCAIAAFVFVSSCKAAILAIVVMFLAFGFIQKRYLLIAAVTLLLVILSGYAVNKGYLLRSDPRAEVIKNSIQIVKERPVTGVGVGNYKVYSDRFTPKESNLQNAHNDYLQILCELGLIGALLFGCFLTTVFVSGRDKTDGYSVALKCGLAAFLVMAMFHFPMEKPAESFLAIVYLGALNV